MKKLRTLVCGLGLAALFGLFATGCTNASGVYNTTPQTDPGDAPSTIKIGVVNPTTGALSGFGEGSPWTEQLLVDYVNNELGGIYIKEYDTKLPIEVIVYDSQSSSTTAAQMAQKLVEEDGVDMLIAHHTPETVTPVCAVAERYGVPCVSADEPIDVWLDNGPYEWSYHAHWQMEDLYQLYLSMWQQQGFGPGSKVGFLFPTDADGNMFLGYFSTHLEQDGYTVVNPGQYPVGTTDYSDIISLFKSEGVEVLCGANNTPDFGSFWLQANQMGFTPSVVTMAKAYLLEADAGSIGNTLVDKCCAEVWWSADRTFTSSLTGMTPDLLAQTYLDAAGRTITPPMAVKYATLEVAVEALQQAQTLEPEALRDALGQVSVDTVMGHIDYNDERYSVIALTGGQWQLQEDGSVELAIIDNSLYPQVPLTGEMRSLK